MSPVPRIGMTIAHCGLLPQENLSGIGVSQNGGTPVALLPVGKRLAVSIAQAAQAGNGWLALALNGIGGVYLLGVLYWVPS